MLSLSMIIIITVGDEILLAGLFRLHTPNRLGDASWRSVFGWLQPKASLAVSLFLQFMTANWLYLITDNMAFWLPFLDGFAEAIETKLQEKGFIGDGDIIGFIDDTTLGCCRPGGGPNHRNGHRWDPAIQRAFYNGWKSMHGLKIQTLDLPNGMNFFV